MIGTSKLDYLFIRACIVFLQYIAPLSAVYCVATFMLRQSMYRIPWPLEIWAVAETLFYLLVYLHNSFFLQRPAFHPPAATRNDRRQLFKKCHQTIDNAELCTSFRSVDFHSLINLWLKHVLGPAYPKDYPKIEMLTASSSADLSKWFKYAPLSEIKRDNVKDFYCWAFLSKGLVDLSLGTSCQGQPQV